MRQCPAHAQADVEEIIFALLGIDLNLHGVLELSRSRQNVFSRYDTEQLIRARGQRTDDAAIQYDLNDHPPTRKASFSVYVKICLVWLRLKFFGVYIQRRGRHRD